MTLDLSALNSATKYPSIETYHEMNLKNGDLIEEKPTLFEGPVVLTEKVDGTNGRIVILPGGDWFIGSREELLYAKGDRIVNPAQSIVPTLLPVAERIATDLAVPMAWFLEVYGHQVGGAAKNYTATGRCGYRLFDIAVIPADVLTWERERIASWRQHGGQQFVTEEELGKAAAWERIELTPRLGTVSGFSLPRDLDGMHSFLKAYVPETQAALDGKPGAAEGIVLRTPDRSVIVKAKVADYERTLRKRAMQAGGKRK